MGWGLGFQLDDGEQAQSGINSLQERTVKVTANLVTQEPFLKSANSFSPRFAVRLISVMDVDVFCLKVCHGGVSYGLGVKQVGLP
jgi:hypothetical protein